MIRNQNNTLIIRWNVREKTTAPKQQFQQSKLEWVAALNIGREKKHTNTHITWHTPFNCERSKGVKISSHSSVYVDWISWQSAMHHLWFQSFFNYQVYVIKSDRIWIKKKSIIEPFAVCLCADCMWAERTTWRGKEMISHSLRLKLRETK